MKLQPTPEMIIAAQDVLSKKHGVWLAPTIVADALIAALAAAEGEKP